MRASKNLTLDGFSAPCAVRARSQVADIPADNFRRRVKCLLEQTGAGGFETCRLFNMVDQAQDRTPAPDLPGSEFPATVADDSFGPASPSVARLYELLDVVDGTYMELMELLSAHRVYQHYVENCRHLGTKPMPLDRALAKWLDAVAEDGHYDFRGEESELPESPGALDYQTQSFRARSVSA